jgi:hypothetical protein
MKKGANEQNKIFQRKKYKFKKKKKPHEEIFNIPGHKGNANQTTLTFHLIPVRIAIIKNTTTNVGQDARKGNP